MKLKKPKTRNSDMQVSSRSARSAYEFQDRQGYTDKPCLGKLEIFKNKKTLWPSSLRAWCWVHPYCEVIPNSDLLWGWVSYYSGWPGNSAQEGFQVPPSPGCWEDRCVLEDKTWSLFTEKCCTNWAFTLSLAIQVSLSQSWLLQNGLLCSQQT